LNGCITIDYTSNTGIYFANMTTVVKILGNRHSLVAKLAPDKNLL